MSYRADKQVITAHTDGRTHRQTQATTIPEGQNWPRVKIVSEFLSIDTNVAGGNGGIGGVGDIMRWYSVRVVGSLMLQETG